MSKKGNKKNLVGGNSAATIAVAEKVPGGKRKKFLDFNISTSNANTGTQQYGAGQSIRSRSLRAGNGSRQSGPRGRNMGDTGPVEHATDHLRMSIPLNREMVTELAPSSTNFNVVSFDINPGLTDVFAWLGLTAQNFQKYYFKQLRFHYVTQCSGYAAQGQQGKVVLAFDLDALEGPPENMKQALSIAPSIMTIPSESVSLEVSPSLLSPENGLFVRKGAVPGDLKTYDIGRLYVITEGIVTTETIGILEVEYEVALRRPRIAGASLSPNPSGITLRSLNVANTIPGSPYVGDTGNGWSAWDDLTPTWPYNLWPQIGTLPVTISSIGGIMLPQGRYRLTAWVYFSIYTTGYNLAVHLTPPAPAAASSFLAGISDSAASSKMLACACPVVCDAEGVTEMRLGLQIGAAAPASGITFVQIMLEYMRTGFEA